MDIDMELCEKMFPIRLKELLTTTSWSTRKLAEKVGVSGGAISRYSNGTMKPKVGTVILISQVTGVNIEWLLGKDVDMYMPIQEKKPVTEKQQALIDLAMELNDKECELMCKLIFDILLHRYSDE